MENNSTTTNADDAEFPQTSAAPNADSALGPAESGAQAPANPLTPAGVEEPSMSSAAGGLPTRRSHPSPSGRLRQLGHERFEGWSRCRDVPSSSAVPSEAPETNLPPIAGEPVTEPGEGDDGGCLGPLTPGRRYPPHSVPGCKNLRRPP